MGWRSVSASAVLGGIRVGLLVAWCLLLAAAGVLAVVVVYGMVQPARMRVSMPAVLAMAPLVGRVGGGGSVRVVVSGGSLSVGGSRLVLLVGFAVIVIEIAVLGVVVWQLRQLAASISRGRPFAAGAGRRVRWIGGAVLVGELVRAGVLLAGGWWAQANLRVPGVRFRHPFALQIDLVVLGLLLILLGGVFDVGARLQHDQDLTI